MERKELTRRWPEIRPRIKAHWNRLADDEHRMLQAGWGHPSGRGAAS